MNKETTTIPYPFLNGGGEMGELTRSFNWSGTALGNPGQWPLSLRTLVGMVLTSRFPMLLFWGSELSTFYNDAFRPSLGNGGKHPSSLGQPGEQAWGESWPTIGPLIRGILAGGESVWFEDQKLPIYRYGRMDYAYWTYSFSPVPDDAGQVAGILVTCSETTRAVENLQRLHDTNKDLQQTLEQNRALQRAQQQSEQQFLHVTNSSPTGLWLSDEEGGLTYLNRTLVEWTGMKYTDLLGAGWANAIIEEDRQRAAQAFLGAVALRAHYDVQFRITKKDGHIIWCRAAGDPYYREDGSYGGYAGFCMDIDEAVGMQQRLEKSRQQLLGLFEQSPVAIAIISKDDLTFKMVNPFYGQLVGRKPEEMIDKPLLEALPELAGQGFDSLLNGVIQTGVPFIAKEFAVAVHTPAGLETFYVDLAYQPLREENNAPSGVLVVATNVTEQVRARKLVEESELFARSIIDNSPVAKVVFVGEQMTITTVNQNMLAMLGRNESILGKPFMEAVPELIPTPLMDRLRRVYTTGETYVQQEEKIELIKDGRRHTGYYNYIYKALRNTAGDIYGIITTATEVTDQVLSRQKVEEAEQALRGAIELAGLATWSLDITEGTISGSERFKEWVGFDINDGKPEENLVMIPEAYRAAVSAAIAAAATEPAGLYNIEHPVINRLNGQERIIHSQGQVFRDADGKPSVLRGMAQDVTLERQHQLALENKVQARTEELAAAVEELRSTNEELAESNQLLTRSNEELAQYAYVASHDLQEPLRKIRLFASTLSHQKKLPDDLVPLVQKIDGSALRMSQLIHDLLEFSSLLKSDKLLRPVDLAEVAANIVSDFELLIEEKKATVRIGSMPRVQAIAMQINQLFYNLLSNALKFSNPEIAPFIEINSRIISLEEAGTQISKPLPFAQYHHITVTDNGIGFDNRYAEQIFEVFKRLHGRESYPGSGIGLAMSRRIANNHNGKLYAESIPGKGSLFHLLLPDKQHEYTAAPPEGFQQTNG